MIDEPGTRIVVASEVAYLFGYRSHNDKDGYLLFGDTPDKDLDGDALFKHNKVFESHRFAELLRGLAKAAGDGLRTGPAIYEQKLTTVHNQWFGVKGGRPVTVVWTYLNPVDEWTARLTPEVKDVVDRTEHFPNYETFNTQLTATQFSLLSDQTAWALACDPSAKIITDLCTPKATP